VALSQSPQRYGYSPGVDGAKRVSKQSTTVWLQSVKCQTRAREGNNQHDRNCCVMFGDAYYRFSCGVTCDDLPPYLCPPIHSRAYVTQAGEGLWDDELVRLGASPAGVFLTNFVPNVSFTPRAIVQRLTCNCVPLLNKANDSLCALILKETFAITYSFHSVRTPRYVCHSSS